MQLTVELFQIEVRAGFVFSSTGLIFLTIGFWRTRHWGFCLLALAGLIGLLQFSAHVYCYYVPSVSFALRLTATAGYLIQNILGLIGIVGVVMLSTRKR